MYPSVVTSCNNVVVTGCGSAVAAADSIRRTRRTDPAPSGREPGGQTASRPWVVTFDEQFWSRSNERRHLRMITTYQVSFKRCAHDVDGFFCSGENRWS